ncbi:uncharacterized protein LOC125429607 isoform X2 [Sphaerodactylus townsendi]|uniref:uncharacterized protein LOC125429607 isoform X2 n=1 Tax=Sphaerodactylus townsendi TaxID=933632 RepID=UPI002025BF48|nr:uncharacterized protein LOC125429607 isoform X2 [Sphaerodactylus townsendi]
MAHRTLLSILEDLTDEDLRVFVFLLPEVPNQTCRIPRGKLDNVSRVQVADLLLQYCPAIELEVVARVLHDLPRRDLLKKYNLRAPAETPRMEAAAAAGPVSEKDLMKLAKNLGKNWRAIGIEYLGVGLPRLEQIEEENPGNAVMRNFYMLKVWKNCEGARATPDRLYHILAQEEVPLDQDAIEFLRTS